MIKALLGLCLGPKVRELERYVTRLSLPMKQINGDLTKCRRNLKFISHKGKIKLLTFIVSLRSYSRKYNVLKQT